MIPKRFSFATNSHNMSKVPWVLSQSLQLNSHVHRMSKKRKEDNVKNIKPQSHLCLCLSATFPMRTRQTDSAWGLCLGLCLGLSPIQFSTIRVSFSMPDRQYRNQRREVTVVHTSAGGRRCSPSFIECVVYWLTALRLLPHGIYSRSIQCHFALPPSVMSSCGEQPLSHSPGPCLDFRSL
jgi:hypothetical protein